MTTKDTIQRLESLIIDATNTPDKLQDGGDEKAKFEQVATIIKRTNAFLKANYEDDSVHLAELADIRFRPLQIVYNPGHYRNDEVWFQGKQRLLNLLDVIKYELKEPKEGQRQGVTHGLFWTIIGVLIPA